MGIELGQMHPVLGDEIYAVGKEMQPFPLRLAEVEATITSRTKLIRMMQLCVIDSAGMPRALLGPGSGKLEAIPLPGKSIGLDLRAIEVLQQAEIGADTSINPIPHIEGLPNGYTQYTVFLGHSLDQQLQILQQQSESLGTENNQLSEPLIAYQTVHRIAKTFGALEAFHDLSLKHGDIGQHYHMDNALLDPFADAVYLVDYAHTRLVSEPELTVLTAETESATARVKKLLAATNLDRLASSILGNYYNQQTWDATTLNQLANSLLTRFNLQPMNATTGYTKAFLDWVTRKQGILYSRDGIDALFEQVQAYYNTQKTLQLQYFTRRTPPTS